MKLMIEPMHESDIDAVLAIEQQIAVVPWTRGHFADSLNAGYSAWIGRCDGRIVGFALWMLAVDEAHLLNLGVSKVWQGRGFGSQLLRTVLTDASVDGAHSLFLEVRPSNEKGLLLYQSFGFKEISRRKGYYPARVPGEREDAVVMRVFLDRAEKCNVTN